MGSIKKLVQKNLTSSKRLWKIVKPSFTDKEIKNEKNIFIVEGETISVNNKIWKKLCDF